MVAKLKLLIPYIKFDIYDSRINERLLVNKLHNFQSYNEM